MNDIVPHTGQQLTVRDQMQMADAMAKANLLPRQYQQNPANVFVAIQMGDALGIKPIVAINEVNVINGTPSLSASLMQSLARAAGHKVRVSGDDTRAVCQIVRNDDPDYTHEAVWDQAKAQKAGLWGKGHWAKDPGTMLRWRAISECVRFACSEVLGGIKYTPDEVADFNPSPSFAAPTQARSARANAGASLRDVAAQRQSPDPGPEQQADVYTGEVIDEQRPEPEAEQPVEEPKASRELIDALVTALNDAGHTTQAQKRERIGKPATAVTTAEALDLIDQLEVEANEKQEAN